MVHLDIDFEVLHKEDLLGKKWTCLFCQHAETITEKGVDHLGKKHWISMSLDDLFDLQIANQNYARMEHKILFDE